jgi:translocation and assembly module TamB
MEHARKLKRYSLLAALVVVVVVLSLVLRGPHVSNVLKKIILSELEAASGQEVIAGKIYINLFPLFIEAKDLKVFDDDGKRILVARRVKSYLDLSGIFSRTVVIRRLVIKEPVIDVTEEQARAIEKNVRAYIARQRVDALKVKVLAVEVQRGAADMISSALKTSVAVKGLGAEVIISETLRLRTDLESVVINREGLPEIVMGISAWAVAKDDILSIRKLSVESGGSRISAGGEISPEDSRIRTTADILVSTFKKLFGLKKRGEGAIRVSGSLQYAKEDLLLDLSLSGDLYLETLMELLDVDEKLEGRVALKGKIQGPLKDLKADGTAVITKGNLYDVQVDRLNCRILYEKGTMRFVDGEGSVYRGKARVSVSITLPVVDYFTVDVEMQQVDSKPLFKLIGWDPGIPAGKVTGVLHHAGSEFDPRGKFEYVGVEKGEDALGRVTGLTGEYDLRGHILTLTDIRLHTGKSEIMAGGVVDIEKETLDLQGSLKAADVTDMTAPYFKLLKGSGAFSGKITGTFEDPVISGRAVISNAALETYPAETISAEVVYRKDLLQVREATAGGKNGSLVFSGSIAFKDAGELFDIAHPVYDLSAEMKHVDAESFVKIFYPAFSGSGRFSSSVKLGGQGNSPVIKAEILLDKASIYNVPFERATGNFNYSASKFEFRKINIRQGDSVVQGDFIINPDETFWYKASSDRLRLSDIIRRPLQGEVIAELVSEGRGSFDNPAINADVRMTEGVLKGKPVGRGMISASLKDKVYSLKGSLINDRIIFTAKGRTDGIMPWEAAADIQTGRYDFLITSMLRDIPEDLILSMNGSVSLHGTRNHIAGSALLKHVVLSMYGYSFTGEDEISLELRDRELSIGSISLKSGDTRLRAGGSLTLGKNYNVTLEGKSALSPFKGLSAKLGLLKGDAEFVMSISGDWDNPKINGGIGLANGAFGLKDYPSYRVTSLNGYLYMDNDRVILHNLNGRLGGGDIRFTGIVYLKKFAFSRFYIEAMVKNITSSLSNEFTVNFDGSILYKGTPESQAVSGNVYINRARYRERVEWKSWLLQAKKIEKFKSEITNLEKAGLNIRITGKDSMIIDNNVARATVSADMVLRGTIYRPALSGRLETRGGTVFFRNNEFNILHASADFADPKRLNPLITITADTLVKGYKIKMNLEGQLDHFNMSLSSDPPLKEMDVLALLTVGQTTGGTRGIEGGIGAGEATSFVTGKLQDVVEERLRSLTGLDRFQVDPYVSRTTGMVEPRVTVSKRMLGDKVFVTFTSAVGSKEEQIVKLEYFMNKNLSLVGVRDERGITGGDVRLRFEFK